MINYTLSPATLSTGSAGVSSCVPDAASASAAAGAVSSSLGTIANLPSTPLGSQKNNGGERRVLRFALQSSARELLPRERVASCLRRPIPSRPTVDVFRSAAHHTAHYGGLQVCGSVWACPVCSAKVTERRRLELAAGTKFWREEAGGFLLLVTYTLRHNYRDNLLDVLSALLGAFEGVHSGRWWVQFADTHRIIGKLRSLEVTHGDSGWHPHIHVLYFIGSGELPGVVGFETALRDRWLHQLARLGRDASWANGVDVRMSDAAIADYIAKYAKEPTWTIEHEMTKAPVKLAKSGGRTAFQLLNEYMLGDEAAGRLFLQYALNFKGKNQLAWSRGLRTILRLDQEKTDIEIANEMEDDAQLLAQLTRDQWRVILANDARAELLNIAVTGDVDAFWSFVNKLIGGVN